MTKALYRIAAENGMSAALLWYRVRRAGMTVEEALATPVRNGKRTPEEISKGYRMYYLKKKVGLTDEQCRLPDEELRRLGLIQPRGIRRDAQIKIGDETLCEYAKRKNIKYPTAYQYYKRHGIEKMKEYYGD